MDDQSFPKYQVSAFKGGRNGKQYVFRTNDEQTFKILDDLMNNLVKEEEDPTEAWGQYCGQCGSKMEHKKGVNSKTNKPWAGWFCTSDESHTPKWERNVL